jgi:mRNA-degrading endonuclease RelE of RelBE toxin-antitoxin system
MRPNPIAPWELRIGRFRVYYEVTEDSGGIVFVLAVGIKDRNIVRIGGDAVEI